MLQHITKNEQFHQWRKDLAKEGVYISITQEVDSGRLEGTSDFFLIELSGDGFTPRFTTAMVLYHGRLGFDVYFPHANQNVFGVESILTSPERRLTDEACSDSKNILAVLWHALNNYREMCIPEGIDDGYDAEWLDLGKAMAHVAKALDASDQATEKK